MVKQKSSFNKQLRTSGLFFVAAVTAVTGVSASSASENGSQLTGRVIVSVEQPSNATINDVAADADGKVKGAVAQLESAALVPAQGQSLTELSEQLKTDSRVESVQLERRATHRGIPNEPSLNLVDPLIDGTTVSVSKSYQWWVSDLGFPAAWDISSGSGRKVAVIDSVDITHPQLAPVVVVSEDSQQPGVHFAATDNEGHGTFVASQACAAYSDGRGLVGAGGRCKLIAINSDLSDFSVAQSIKRAADLGADSIVMSFGVDGAAYTPDVIQKAIDYAYDKGSVPIAAAADAPVTEQGYPARYLQPDGATSPIDGGKGLSVTSSDANRSRSSFAGFGSQISVMAPGNFFGSAGPNGLLGAFPAIVTGQFARARRVFDGDSRYASIKGTSVSTPIVGGLVSLVKGANSRLKPKQIIRIIKASAAGGGSWSQENAYGTVQAAAAVKSARSFDTHAPKASFVTLDKAVKGRRVKLLWRKTDSIPGSEKASGTKEVQIWRSTDGMTRRLVGTFPKAQKSASLGIWGRRNTFWVVAVDNNGNVMKLSNRGQAKITILRKR